MLLYNQQIEIINIGNFDPGISDAVRGGIVALDLYFSNHRRDKQQDAKNINITKVGDLNGETSRKYGARKQRECEPTGRNLDGKASRFSRENMERGVSPLQWLRDRVQWRFIGVMVMQQTNKQRVQK